MTKKVQWKQTSKQEIAWEYLNDKTTNELLFGGGAGGAKSYLGCAWLIINCGRYPETRWLMGRAKLKTLKETTLKTFFEVCKHWGIKKDIDYKYNPIDGVIKWDNGSEIILKDLFYYPADPNFDELGSLEITGAFIDEVNQIVFKAWDIVRSRIRYKLDDYGLVPKILGTCNPAKNWVYNHFYKPNKDGLLTEDIKFIQALVQDNPFNSKHYIDNLKKIKDKATKERLLYGNWEYDDDPAVLMDFDVITDLFTNKVDSGDKFISGDVSRKGRDKMAIIYWEGLDAKDIVVIPDEIKRDTTKAKKYIQEYAERKGVRRSHIVLDEDGVGGGLVDQLECKGFINNSTAIQPDEAKFDSSKKVNYGNLKAQCYFMFAQKATEGEIAISADVSNDIKDEIVEELGQIKEKNIDKDGKKYIIEKSIIKDNIGRSPDFADALMMRMYFEVVSVREPRVW